MWARRILARGGTAGRSGYVVGKQAGWRLQQGKVAISGLRNRHASTLASSARSSSAVAMLARADGGVVPIVMPETVPARLVMETSRSSIPWLGIFLGTGVCAATALSGDSTAHAAGKNSREDDAEDIVQRVKKTLQEFADTNLSKLQGTWPAGMQDVQNAVNDFIHSGKPSQISFGFMMGVCSGFALRKASKLGALTLGSMFVLLQLTSYTGYIDVNYQKMERDFMNLLDVNHDGKVDAKDVDDVYQRVLKVLEFSLPAGSGFAVGFAVGFRAG